MFTKRSFLAVLSLMLVAMGSWDCCRRICPVAPRIHLPGSITATTTSVVQPPPSATFTRTPTPLPPTLTATAQATSTATSTVTPLATATAVSTAQASMTAQVTVPATATSTGISTSVPTYAATMTATWVTTAILSQTVTAQATATHTPTPPATPQATPTTTATVFYQGGPGIFIDATATSYSNAVSLYMTLIVNGQAEMTATGTLTGPGVDVTLTNNGQNSYYYDMGTGLGDAFQAGQSYTLTVNTSLGTVSRTLVAPGKATVSTNGLTATWSPESDTDRLWVFGNGGSTFYAPSLGNNLNSPFSIPGSAYPTAGTYQVRVDTTNEGGIAGTDPASLFRITQYSTTTVVK